MRTPSIQAKFQCALDELVELLKQDRTILAALLCGSLSHDAVWEKSDIDLALITVDDRKNDTPHRSLNAQGVNVHAFLMSRADFRHTVEGVVRNSFMHSLLAKGRILYTHDETIAALCSHLHEIGERDTQVQLLEAGNHAILPINKAHKWLITRNDLDYAALWILHAATPLARIEVLSARLLTDREVIPQAMKLNPEFFGRIYRDLLNTRKTRKNVQAALDSIDAYLARHARVIFRPILDHLTEVGEVRSCTEIDAHFQRNLGIASVTPACEYLADQGLLWKASTPAQLTRKSNLSIQELAFASREPEADEF